MISTVSFFGCGDNEATNEAKIEQTAKENVPNQAVEGIVRGKYRNIQFQKRFGASYSGDGAGSYPKVGFGSEIAALIKMIRVGVLSTS
ncbi:MAG: hypothetical protein ACU85E_03095 [Gammaproteobacteria bacterium]